VGGQKARNTTLSETDEVSPLVEFLNSVIRKLGMYEFMKYAVQIPCEEAGLNTSTVAL
jgi:hypothetical protein